MEDLQKVLDRIKKLMAMAADASSPNEAAIAAKRARSLMDKHQVSMGDLMEKSPFSTKKVAKARKFIAAWEQALAIAIAKLNDCVAAREETAPGVSELVFRGFESDVSLAEYMFVYLVGNGRSAYAKYAEQLGHTKYVASVGTAYKNSYAAALVIKLREMMAEREQELLDYSGKSLVVIKKDLVEKEFGTGNYKNKSAAKIKDENSLRAANAGYQRGMATPIHTEIK